MLYDHNTYFLSSPVCQSCLSDLYRKLTEHFRPELFDDSDRCYKERLNIIDNIFNLRNTEVSIMFVAISYIIIV
jgi:hypothetical protein